jgi:hypothetical protein
VNIRHEILDWFGLSREVMVIHLVLIYYAIEIDYSLFLSESFGFFWGSLGIVLDVDLCYVFIVGEASHRV